MSVLTEQEKRDNLQELLIELGESQDVLQDSKTREEYFSRLESIYHNMGSDNFRHYYSDIFSCLTIIDGDTSTGNLDILTDNIRILKEQYRSKNKDVDGKIIDITKEINKLYDHVNLDIGRISYNKKMNGETASELARVNSLITDLEEQIKTTQTKAEERINTEFTELKNEVSEGQKSMQNEYITILGIFAAIVLAFTGGMTFAASALENINAVTPYRLLSVVLIIGLILINLIWMLLDFIREINGKEFRVWWIVLIADLILIIGLWLNYLAFKQNWFEKEDSSHTQLFQEESSTIDSTLLPEVNNHNRDTK